MAAGQDSEEIITDRPDRTESAATIAKGFVQIEAGASYTSDDGTTYTYSYTVAGTES